MTRLSLSRTQQPIPLATRPRRSLHRGAQPAPEPISEAGPSNTNSEEELEAWQDFAADHYETVEQLPLELHRNFRLLRELDDGSSGQMTRLKSLIREYIKNRRKVEQSEAITPELGNQFEAGPAAVYQPESADSDPAKQESDARSVSISLMDIDEPQQVRGVPVPDGQGGLLIPAPLPESLQEIPAPPLNGPADTEIDGADHEESRRAFPPTNSEPMPAAIPPVDGDMTMGPVQVPVLLQEDEMMIDPALLSPDGANGIDVPENQTPTLPQMPEPETAPVSGVKPNLPPAPISNAPPKLIRPPGPHDLLPEIARLAREMIRTNDEKVAVAVGAYNAIDRHIRALDSALTAQEASILLGLRPSTLPSNAIDSALNTGAGSTKAGAGTTVNGEKWKNGGGDEGEMELGTGGGGRRKKSKKMKRGQKGKDEKEREEDKDSEDWNIPADPNEPKYCYCNRVSFGQMIGCDNDDCPLEWFHIQCIGLENPPTGKWLCDICKPKGGPSVGGTAGGGLKKRKR